MKGSPSLFCPETMKAAPARPDSPARGTIGSDCARRLWALRGSVSNRVARGCWRCHVVMKRESDMARSYYSTGFEQPAESIWRVIRDFNNYPV
jgi:hypothetical protein